MELYSNLFAAVLAAAAFEAGGSQADPIVLTFEGVGVRDGEQAIGTVDEFCNGGTDFHGNSGTNYGVGFERGTLLAFEHGPDLTAAPPSGPMTPR